jgi:hypothetical protein
MTELVALLRRWIMPKYLSTACLYHRHTPTSVLYIAAVGRSVAFVADLILLIIQSCSSTFQPELKIFVIYRVQQGGDEHPNCGLLGYALRSVVGGYGRFGVIYYQHLQG